MKDETAKQNILRCSRCGLCQGICPIYDEIKNENVTARGKLMQILGLKKGDLKLNRKILNSLDLCLNCEKCKINCPSGIETTDVFNFEKKLGLIEKFLHSQFVFNAKIFSLKAFSLFKKAKKYEKTSDILYFEGCIAKELKNGLTLKGVKLQNGGFQCCGLPYLTKGREDIYRQIMEHNEQIIESARLVVFDCATCYSAVKNYEFKNPKNKEKLIFYTDFYKEKTYKLQKPADVTYHMPCHLKSTGVELGKIEDILKSVKNLNYIRANKAENCCGFGGDFFIRHPKIAFSIAMKKAHDIAQTNADIVLSSCPTCLWSLNFSLFVYKIKHKLSKVPKVCDMADFFNNNCTEYKPLNTEKEQKSLIKV